MQKKGQAYIVERFSGPDGYALVQRFSKINISLIIESIAK